MESTIRKSAVNNRLAGSPDRRCARSRRGMSLLVCLFILSIVSLLVLGMLDSATLNLSTARNTADYERAAYLAGAGVHHALAELEQNKNWRGVIPSTEFPSGSGRTYSSTIVDGAANEVIITGIGLSGGVARSLQVTVEIGG